MPRMRVLPLLAATSLLVPLWVPQQSSKAITGAVTTQDGKPLAGVLVYTGVAAPCCRAKTDENGGFKIVKDGDVLHFRKPGLELKAIVLHSGDSDIRVTMSPARNDLTLGICPNLRAGELEVGSGFPGVRLRIDQRSDSRADIKSEQGSGGYLTFTITLKDRAASLHVRGGPNSLRLDTADESIIASTDFTERSIVNSDGEIRGIDSRGQLENGHAWRITGVYQLGMAAYSDADEKDAKVFDDVVDSMCLARAL
jgi:hypothetical protein